MYFEFFSLFCACHVSLRIYIIKIKHLSAYTCAISLLPLEYDAIFFSQIIVKRESEHGMAQTVSGIKDSFVVNCMTG